MYKFAGKIILGTAMVLSLSFSAFAAETVLGINDGPVEEELAASEQELKSMQDGSMLPTYTTGTTTRDTLIEIVDAVDDFKAFQPVSSSIVSGTDQNQSAAVSSDDPAGTDSGNTASAEQKNAVDAEEPAAKSTAGTASGTSGSAASASSKSGSGVLSVAGGPSEGTSAVSKVTSAIKSALYSTSGVPAVQTTAARQAIISYAKQFLGNPYVYGGTSLTEGCDCSGFTQGVYQKFGIATGRSSRDQYAKCTQIPLSRLQPGDLVFYASGDYVNHVALYCGDGIIIHAANSRTGIVTSRYDYRTPYGYGTFIND